MGAQCPSVAVLESEGGVRACISPREQEGGAEAAARSRRALWLFSGWPRWISRAVCKAVHTSTGG